jgi:hypothetical protein
MQEFDGKRHDRESGERDGGVPQVSEEPSPAVPQAFDHARDLLMAIEESLFAQFGASFRQRISRGGPSGQISLSKRFGRRLVNKDVG